MQEVFGKPLKARYKRQRYMYDERGHKFERVPPPLAFSPFILAAILAAVAVPLIIMNIIKTDPVVAEWWTINIAQRWERIVGTLTSVLPISVFELIVVIGVGLGIYLLVRFFIDLYGGKFWRIGYGVLTLGIAAVYILNLYTMSMGFGYYRSEMPIYQSGAKYSLEQVQAATDYFLSDYNAVSKKLERDENGEAICPYSFRTLAEKLSYEYGKLDTSYFFEYTPIGKPIVNSKFLSAVNIAGITFLPTGEANVNTDAPSTYMVFTLAHEIAHTKGIQREGDANMIAQLVLLSAEDDYLRYCGYYQSFSHLAQGLQLAGDRDAYMNAIAAVDPNVYAEKRHERDYWAAQPDIMTKIGEFFNNMYLQSNGAENGTGSYTDGNKTDTVTPIDPGTGKPQINPDTGKPVVIPIYSTSQKTYFYIYENRSDDEQSE